MTTPNYAVAASELTNAANELDAAIERLDHVTTALGEDELDRIIDDALNPLDASTAGDLRAELATASRLLSALAAHATELAP